MYTFVYVTLATFWAWESVRYALEWFAGRAFAATRPFHPLVVAALPLFILWPDWVRSLGVAGAVGILHLAVTRYLAPPAPPQIPARSQYRTGLPPLP